MVGQIQKQTNQVRTGVEKTSGRRFCGTFGLLLGNGKVSPGKAKTHRPAKGISERHAEYV